MTSAMHSQTLAEAKLPDKADLQASMGSKSTANHIPDVPAIVEWQFDNHQGFVHSFINTIRHGPLMNQQSAWKKFVIPSEVEAQEGQPQPDGAILTTVKCWLCFGESDGVGIAKEVGENLGRGAWWTGAVGGQDGARQPWLSSSRQ